MRLYTRSVLRAGRSEAGGMLEAGVPELPWVSEARRCLNQVRCHVGRVTGAVSKATLQRHSAPVAGPKLEGNIVPRDGVFVRSELPQGEEGTRGARIRFFASTNLTDTEVSRHHVWTERPITQLCLAKTGSAIVKPRVTTPIVSYTRCRRGPSRAVGRKQQLWQLRVRVRCIEN